MNLTKPTAKAILVWLICVFFYLYEFLLRTILGTFQQPIMHELNLTQVQFALLSSTSYLLVYGLMQIPVGIIVDRFGLKKSMFVAVLICALSNLGFGFVTTYEMAVFNRILMGLGSSFGFVCLLVAVYDWMPKPNIAFFIGLSQFFGTLGPMLAGGPLNTLASTGIVGWREIFIALAGIGIILSLVILLFVEKNKQHAGNFIILSRPQATLDNLRILIKQPQIWCIMLGGAFIYFSLEYLSENEGKNFLMHRGFSSNFSSYMITLAWLGFAIGSPIVGYFSDKIKRRKPFLLFSALATFIALIGIIYLPNLNTIIAPCFLLLGLGIGASGIGIVVIGEQCKTRYLAAGLGLNNGLIMLLVSITAPIIGSILLWESQQVPLLTAYHYSFSLLVLMPLVSLFIILFGIRETFAKPAKENTILNVRTS
ncbi:major facilitator superfamily (MFS) transporter [Legionella beliardensis]|uniref:Lysosomal dipeptide transporter MFSD1 n=1 Tax=Legionella beliardensis TaxID=91822 RepID=A0A378I1K7_9GAMM|nr:MFS transporter [Legionella beliardensis]STX28506.1 major facilitator superfamily (MFS) transporter [Legionella beliardensis]